MPRAVRSQETRQRIYRSALELFREHGYDQVTIREICEAAGVAVGTFYHFFGSKDGTLLYGLAAEDESVDTLLAGLAD
nr:helix-turn-helix transcriptional regulator [Actinomycetales bacterium]